MEIVYMEGNDTKDMNKRFVEAELKIWKKVEDIAYAVGKHPDEVFVDLMIQFSEFIEKQYPTQEYPNEKSAKEQIRKGEVERPSKKLRTNLFDINNYRIL